MSAAPHPGGGNDRGGGSGETPPVAAGGEGTGPCGLHGNRVTTPVVCAECGVEYCPLCEPLRGAGQMCGDCYARSLSRFAGARDPGEGATLKRRARAWWQKDAGETLGEWAEKARSLLGGSSPRAGGDREGVRARRARPDGAALAGRLASLMPFYLEPKRREEGVPPLGAAWYKLAAAVAAGTALSVAAVWLTGRRSPLVSLAVALLVAVGCVWALGCRFGPRAGAVASSLVVVSLLAGEVAVQLLYRLGAIESLDLTRVSILPGASALPVYREYFFDLIVLRLLPPAALAFLVGLWPPGKRPALRKHETAPVGRAVARLKQLLGGRKTEATGRSRTSRGKAPRPSGPAVRGSEEAQAR